MEKIDLINQISVSQNTLKKILSQYNIYDFTFYEMKNGIENTSLLIKTKENTFVLRIYRRFKKTNKMIKQELQFQDYLRDKKIPIPYIFSNINNEKLTLVEIDNIIWQIILMQFMGESDFVSYTPELISELAQLQAKMHKAGSLFAKIQQKHKSIISELKGIISDSYLATDINDEETFNFIQCAKEFHLSLSPHLPYGYNHLDYDTFGNILVKNNRVTAILDFDDLSYSPSIVCLGYTLWHILYSSNNIQSMRQYLLDYEIIRPLTKDEKTLLPQIILFRNYTIGTIGLTAGKKHKSIRHFLDLEKIITNLKFDD